MTPSWIWLPDAPPGIDVFVFARRAFTVAVGTQARARITCDGRYVLFLNGSEIGRGPVRSEPRDRSFDTYDVTLQAGINVVGVLARHYGRPTLYWKPDPARTGGGFIAEVTGVVYRCFMARVARAVRAGGSARHGGRARCRGDRRACAPARLARGGLRRLAVDQRRRGRRSLVRHACPAPDRVPRRTPAAARRGGPGSGTGAHARSRHDHQRTRDARRRCPGRHRDRGHQWRGTRR